VISYQVFSIIYGKECNILIEMLSYEVQIKKGRPSMSWTGQLTLFDVPF
jgi:hypothetical protein